MSHYSFRSSPTDSWSSPRPHRDPTLRRIHYGPILPMEDRRKSLLARLLKAI